MQGALSLFNAEALAGSPVVFYAGCLVAGLMFGSFLNVVIHRYPAMYRYRRETAACRTLGVGPPYGMGPPDNLVWPGSRCPHCGRRIRFWENIPLLSYVMLRGKCAGCRQGIGWRYPLVEVLGGAITVWAGWEHGVTLMMPIMAALGYVMLVAVVLAIEEGECPAPVLLLILAGGLLSGYLDYMTGLDDSVAAAAVGGAVAWVLYRVSWASSQRVERAAGSGGPGLLAAAGLALCAYGAWLGLGSVALLAGLYVPAGLLCAGLGALCRLAGARRVEWRLLYFVVVMVTGWVVVTVPDTREALLRAVSGLSDMI